MGGLLPILGMSSSIKCAHNGHGAEKWVIALFGKIVVPVANRVGTKNPAEAGLCFAELFVAYSGLYVPTIRPITVNRALPIIIS